MRLSEMSDTELKEHYKKLEEEKRRRARIQEEIRRERMPRIREETQLEYNMRICPKYYRGEDKLELKDIPLLILCIIIVGFIFVTGFGI